MEELKKEFSTSRRYISWRHFHQVCNIFASEIKAQQNTNPYSVASDLVSMIADEMIETRKYGLQHALNIIPLSVTRAS